MRGGQPHATAAPGQSVDGVLRQHLDGPLEKHGVAFHLRQTGLLVVLHHDRVGERRYPRLEVAGDAGDERAGVDVVELRLAPDALEPVGDAIEPIEIGAHVQRGRGRRLVLRPLLHQLDPSGEAGERSPQLMRRLARHAGPQTLARRVAAGPDDVDPRQQQDGGHARLQRRDDPQPAHDGRIAVVDFSNE